MQRFARLFAVAVLVLPFALFLPSVASAASTTWNVPGDGTNTCTTADPSCNTIQAAVNAASAGDTINVAAGTYDAFSVVGKTNLTISGASTTSTLIKPTTLINTGVGHKYTSNMQVSVFVNNSTNITIKKMGIEDNGQAPGMGGPDALLFWNASTGTISSSAIAATYTINGDQTGQGIAVDAGSGQSSNLTVDSDTITGFQKNGIDAVDGNAQTSNAGTITVTVKNGAITGAGSTSTIAQNGILLWNQGGGTVTGTVNGTNISDLEYAPTPEATGILAYGSASIPTVSDVTFKNVDLYINSASSGTAIDATSGNTFDGVSPAAATGAQLATIENKLYGIMEDGTVDPIYILPNTFIVTTTNLGMAQGLKVATSGDTVLVTPGTYAGDITPPASDKVTLAGIGGPIITLGSGYGINLDNNVAVTNFTFSGFTVNASPSTTYAFKAYKANGLTLTNDTFNGGSGNTGGGVDINTTSNVTFNNITSSGFHKNGFADTSAYSTADSATPGNNIIFNGITSSNNGWTGIAFYTAGSAGGSASITGVQFTGTSTISANGAGGATQGGIFIEGDSDANLAANKTPANTVTTDGTTLNLNDLAFSGNSAFDIINYQTAPVTALAATFSGLTGNQMNASQRTAEDAKIYDHLDNSALGLVTYYTPVTPGVTTDPETNVTSSDVTLNGTNGQVAAQGESFWVSTSTIDTSSPNIPSGVYSTPVLSGVDANAAFSDQLSLVTTQGITTGGVQQNMPAITPNTTYYFVAWSEVNGTWYPGAVLSTTTSPASNVTVTIVKYLDGSAATAASANSASFPMQSSWNAANIGGAGSGTYDLGTDDNYQAVTSPMSAGSSYATNEITGGSVVGADCSTGAPYALSGYSEGSSLAAAAAATPTTTAPNFSNLQNNEYVIVWNVSCPPAATYQVHILKYLDNQEATASSAGGYLFPMQSSWTAANIGSGSGTYTLGNNYGGSSYLYGADTVPMDSGYSYATDEVTNDLDATSKVLPTGADCVSGDYQLQGYKVGDNFADAAAAATSSSVSITGGTSDEYVIVYNTTCPTTGSLVVNKDTIGGTGTFTFSGDNGLGSFSITTTGSKTGGAGSKQFLSLAPGTYHITETNLPKGWTQSDSDCSSVVVTAGAETDCTVTNTSNKLLGAISGTVFNDKDGDGSVSDGHNKRIAGVTVYLDTNNNGVLNNGELSTVTDAHGNYSFTGLPAGTYTVREVAPSGFVETAPAKGSYTVKLSAGDVVKHEDFGNFALASISGVVFNDQNGNGRDNNEPGLSGWTVKITGPHGFSQTTTTGAGGAYSFTGLPAAGVYKLTEVVQSGWKQTAQPGSVYILSGTNSTKDNFGDELKPVKNR